MITHGNRVVFVGGDYEGERGIILGYTPRQHRDDTIKYRIQLQGYPMRGRVHPYLDKHSAGWNGVVIEVDDNIRVVGGRNASGVASRTKPRPYGGTGRWSTGA